MIDENYQSKRIKNIVSLCPTTKEVYEIGCDHGYVTMSLLLTGKTQNVIATDISMQAINKAIINCQKKNLLPRICFRQGDGFKPLTRYDKATVSILSGLGGKEIVRILEGIPSKIDELIINPMTDEYMVREWLVSNKFKITKDFMFEDENYYYTVIHARRARLGERTTLEPLYMYFGKDNFNEENKEDFVKYLKIEEEKIITLYRQIGQVSNSLNTKYQLITESLNKLGIALLPIT